MKRMITILLCLSMLPGIAKTATAQENNRTLIVYFSESGNTRNMATRIHAMTSSDLVEIEMQNPYSDNYSTLLEQAEEDLLANARPPLRTRIENIDQYDTILLGYPNWYAILPMPVFTFLESYDFSGKRIIPFCSHGNGMLGETVANICKLCPGADVREALSVTYSGGSSLDNEIYSWLGRHNLINEEGNNEENYSMNIKITIGDQTITATMENNVTVRDLLSRLPLEITLEDYNNTTEKIYYPSPALNTENAPRGCAPVAGDITLYVPWGNVAIFCKNWSQSNDLIKLGHIDNNGIEMLKVSGDVKVKIESLQNE